LGDARSWNGLVTAFDELRAEVLELTTATQQYGAGASTALAAQADLAEAFLRMAQGKSSAPPTAPDAAGSADGVTSASSYLPDAEHFVDVCRIAREACAEGEFAGDLAKAEQQLQETKEQLDAVVPSLEKAEEFRLELSHYHLKLTTELGCANPAAAQAALDNASSGKKKSSSSGSTVSLFGGSKDKKVAQNLEKREKALAQFNIFVAEAKRQLAPLEPLRLRVRLLELHLAEQQSLHKRYTLTLADCFEQLAVRGESEHGGSQGGDDAAQEEGEEGGGEEYYDDEDGAERAEGEEGEYFEEQEDEEDERAH
jgi:hypothetical protein